MCADERRQHLATVRRHVLECRRPLAVENDRRYVGHEQRPAGCQHGERRGQGSGRQQPARPAGGIHPAIRGPHQPQTGGRTGCIEENVRRADESSGHCELRHLDEDGKADGGRDGTDGTAEHQCRAHAERHEQEDVCNGVGGAAEREKIDGHGHGARAFHGREGQCEDED
jgi:hypothetical protein